MKKLFAILELTVSVFGQEPNRPRLILEPFATLEQNGKPMTNFGGFTVAQSIPSFQPVGAIKDSPIWGTGTGYVQWYSKEPIGITFATNSSVVIHAPVVTVVTNVVDGHNGAGCGTCKWLRDSALKGSIPALNHPYHESEPWRDPTEKWTITNVIRTTSIKIVWDGETRSLDRVEALSSMTNMWKMEWRKE